MTAEANADEAHNRTLLDALYRKYYRPLLRFLSRQRIGTDEAAEIVQETYCRMHQVSNVEALEFPKAYLFRTAANLARDRQRQQRRLQGHEQSDIERLELASDEPGPYRILRGEQELEIARQALAELSPKCRRAFVMNRFQNATYQEIADELGVSVSMIEKYISQALAHIKTRVGGARRGAPHVRVVKWRR